MKKNIEKIRDDLYVKKGMGGTYSVVYPLKDTENKPIKGNFKRALLSDVKQSIPMILIVGVLLMMLVPGAIDIKNQCEENINYVLNNACEFCYDDVLGQDTFNQRTFKFNESGFLKEDT